VNLIQHVWHSAFEALEHWADRKTEPPITTALAPSLSPLSVDALPRERLINRWSCCDQCCTDQCGQIFRGHVIACCHQMPVNA
jgi:hypothetical protein